MELNYEKTSAEIFIIYKLRQHKKIILNSLDSCCYLNIIFFKFRGHFTTKIFIDGHMSTRTRGSLHPGTCPWAMPTHPRTRSDTPVDNDDDDKGDNLEENMLVIAVIDLARFAPQHPDCNEQLLQMIR